MDRTGVDTMGAVTQRSRLSRRTFLRVVGNASGAALASSLLGACGSSPTASGAQVVNLLWSDVTNIRAPLIADFTNTTGICRVSPACNVCFAKQKQSSFMKYCAASRGP